MLEILSMYSITSLYNFEHNSIDIISHKSVIHNTLTTWRLHIFDRYKILWKDIDRHIRRSSYYNTTFYYVMMIWHLDWTLCNWLMHTTQHSVGLSKIWKKSIEEMNERLREKERKRERNRDRFKSQYHYYNNWYL